MTHYEQQEIATLARTDHRVIERLQVLIAQQAEYIIELRARVIALETGAKAEVIDGDC